MKYIPEEKLRAICGEICGDWGLYVSVPAAGEKLVIDHMDMGTMSYLRLRIHSGDEVRSVLDKRTQGSSNDLYVSPGFHQIQMTAGGRGRITISASGRFA